MVSMAMTIEASDAIGQCVVRVSSLPSDSTVHELVQGLLPRMRLPRADSQGRALTYRARLEREGRYLNGSETVGEVLRPEDRIVLQPSVTAGGACAPASKVDSVLDLCCSLAWGRRLLSTLGRRVMPGKSHYQYVLELFKPDQAMTPVGRTPLDFDTAPVLEWASFTAARQTPPRATDFMAAAVAIDPLWDATLGEPYVDGLRATLTMDDRGAVECVVPTTCFLGQARQAVAGLIRGGALAAGTKVRFLVIAIPRPLDSGGAEDVIRFCVEAVPRPLPLAASRLEAFTDRAKAYERIDPVDVPAFIPQPLLDGVAAISRAGRCVGNGWHSGWASPRR